MTEEVGDLDKDGIIHPILIITKLVNILIIFAQVLKYTISLLVITLLVIALFNG